MLPRSKIKCLTLDGFYICKKKINFDAVDLIFLYFRCYNCRKVRVIQYSRAVSIFFLELDENN